MSKKTVIPPQSPASHGSAPSKLVPRVGSGTRRGAERSGRRLVLRLTMPGCNGFIWHCHKRKKMPVIEAKKADFPFALWPGHGLMAMTACDATNIAREIRGAGKYPVECGAYVIEAFWRVGAEHGGNAHDRHEGKVLNGAVEQPVSSREAGQL